MGKTIQICVISDNHGRMEPIEYINRTYGACDYRFHLGDSEMPRSFLLGFACVRGNNDYSDEYPEKLILPIGSHRFLLTHGHRSLLFYDPAPLAAYAQRNKCDVVCYGHTHVYNDTVIDGIRMLNPGSIGRNRDGSEPSYMILTLFEDGSIKAIRQTYHNPISKFPF